MGIRTILSDLACRSRHRFLAESFAIPSHLTIRERLELARLAQAPGLRNIVEIGSYLGASAAAFGAGLARSANADAKIYCVDTWNNDSMSEGQRDTMALFLRNTATYRHTIVTVRGWSTEVFDTIAAGAGRIDLLFIDGDHSYEGCLADWKAYAPLLAPAARVAFHDVGWAEGVRKVIDQEVRGLVVREERLPNLWWGELA
jgi:predicted O-methyltransferase YrrM